MEISQIPILKNKELQDTREFNYKEYISLPMFVIKKIFILKF